MTNIFSMPQLLLILYGCILLSGAYFGWKAGSRISLIMGMMSGLLVFAGVYWTTMNPASGHAFLAVISGLLSIVFVVRLIKTRKFMPSGMLLAVNVAAFMLTASQSVIARNEVTKQSLNEIASPQKAGLAMTKFRNTN